MEFQENNPSVSTPKYPPGFRFKPTHEEIFRYYLLPKKTDNQNCWWINSMIKDGTLNDGVDLLQYQPWELPGMIHEIGEGYYYYKRETKSKATGATNCERRIKDDSKSFWKKSGKKTVKEKTGPGTNDVIVWGFKHMLNHHNGPNDKTEWLMCEYELDSSFAPYGDPNLVMCKVYRKNNDKDEGSYCDTGNSSKRRRVSAANSVDTTQIQQNFRESAAVVSSSSTRSDLWLPNGFQMPNTENLRRRR